MNIPTYRFEFEGAQITVEQETGWTFADAQLVYNKLLIAGVYSPDSERQRMRAIRFAEAVVQTVSVEGSLGFDFPTPDSSGEQLAAAFDAFGKRKGLVGAFYQALQQVEQVTPGDAELKKMTPLDSPQEPTSESPLTTGSAADEPPPKN